MDTMKRYVNFPQEIHMEIFDHLSIPDIVALGDTCKSMRALIQNATLKLVIYQFEAMPDLNDDAKANISQLSIYWASRVMISLTEHHVEWSQHLTNINHERPDRLEDYELWLVDRLRCFTQRGATFSLHWSTGFPLQKLFLRNSTITPTMRFMIENGASFTSAPLGIHELLRQCMDEGKSGQLTQLLLDHGARYQLMPGGAGYHFQRTWMKTIGPPGIDPIHVVLMLNAGILPADAPEGAGNLLLRTFVECDELEWVQLLLDLGVNWTDVEAPLCDTLAIAWRELRSPRRRQFLEDNGGSRVNTGQWRTSNFIRRVVQDNRESAVTWILRDIVM